MKPLAILLICSIVLTGCMEPNYLERIALITAVGYDRHDDGIEGTVTFFQFDPTKNEVSDTLSTSSNTSKGVRSKLNVMTSHEMVSGQVRVAVYGREIAEEGMFSLVDTLARDPAIGAMLYVVTSDGRAKDIFYNKSATGMMNVGNYLYLMLEQNISCETIVSSTLHEFLELYYDEGIDPIVPIVSHTDDAIFVKGSAIFLDDKQVGEVTLHETFYIKVLKDQFNAGELEIPIKKEALNKILKGKSTKPIVYATIDNIESSSSIKLKDEQKPDFQVNVNMEARLLEISTEIQSNPNAMRTLEKEVEVVVKEEIEQVLKKLQSMNSDPVGFGSHFIRNGKVNIGDEDWRTQLKDATYDVQVDVNIYSSGVME